MMQEMSELLNWFDVITREVAAANGPRAFQDVDLDAARNELRRLVKAEAHQDGGAAEARPASGDDQPQD